MESQCAKLMIEDHVYAVRCYRVYCTVLFDTVVMIRDVAADDLLWKIGRTRMGITVTQQEVYCTINICNYDGDIPTAIAGADCRA